MKKLLIILALAALIAAYVFFGVGDYLTVDGIKRVAGEVDGYYQRHPVQVVGLFFLTYVAVTAASLPGARCPLPRPQGCTRRLRRLGPRWSWPH